MGDTFLEFTKYMNKHIEYEILVIGANKIKLHNNLFFLKTKM
jgi:hypothetical protein